MVFRLRPTVIFVSFVIATAGYLINVPGKSPLDALPLAWTWFSLWLLLSAGAALWERYLGPPRARRRRTIRDRFAPNEPSELS